MKKNLIFINIFWVSIGVAFNIATQREYLAEIGFFIMALPVLSLLYLIAEGLFHSFRFVLDWIKRKGDRID